MKLVRVVVEVEMFMAIPDDATHEDVINGSEINEALRSQLVTHEELGTGYVVELVEDVNSLDDAPEYLQDDETRIHGMAWCDNDAKTLREHFEREDERSHGGEDASC